MTEIKNPSKKRLKQNSFRENSNHLELSMSCNESENMVKNLFKLNINYNFATFISTSS